MSAISAALRSIAGMKTGAFGQHLRVFTALLPFISADGKIGGHRFSRRTAMEE
jgi:hypothetical protein